MAVALRASGKNSSGSSLNYLRMTMPTVEDGDLIVCVYMSNAGSTLPIVTGWDELHVGVQLPSTAAGVGIVTKIADSEGATIDAVFSAVQNGANGSIYTFSGAGATNAAAAHEFAYATSGTNDKANVVPSVTTTIDGCYILIGCFNGGTTNSYTAPAGWTLGLNDFWINEHQTCTDDVNQAAAGATGTHDIVGTANARDVTFTLAIAPPAGGAAAGAKGFGYAHQWKW